MLKRKLSCETNVNIKRKKRNITNSILDHEKCYNKMLDNISHCTKEFDNELLEEFQGNTQNEYFKFVRYIFICCIYFFMLCIIIYIFFFIDVKTSKKDEKNKKCKMDTNKIIKYLDGKFFKESFNSNNSNNLDRLREFIKICNENKEKDLAAEYLNAGGNIFDILKLLNTADKKEMNTAIIVFSAVRILIIK